MLQSILIDIVLFVVSLTALQLLARGFWSAGIRGKEKSGKKFILAFSLFYVAIALSFFAILFFTNLDDISVLKQIFNILIGTAFLTLSGYSFTGGLWLLGIRGKEKRFKKLYYTVSAFQTGIMCVGATIFWISVFY